MLTRAYELEPRPVRALNPSKEARFSFFICYSPYSFSSIECHGGNQLNHREQCAPKAATYAATHSLAHRIERSRRDLGVQERLVLCHWKKHLFQIWAETWFFCILYSRDWIRLAEQCSDSSTVKSMHRLRLLSSMLSIEKHYFSSPWVEKLFSTGFKLAPSSLPVPNIQEVSGTETIILRLFWPPSTLSFCT